MLIDFSFGNFRSFKDLHTLSMVAANITSRYEEVDRENVARVGDKLKLLKSKAIYGANASGKSNIVKAMFTFLTIARRSVRHDDILTRLIEPFALNTETENQPSYFQVIFISDGVTWRYGFEATPNRIVTEWLFGNSLRKEVPYFVREGMDVKVNQGAFREAKKFEGLSKTGDSEIFRENSLFLGAVAALGGQTAKKVQEAMGRFNVISGLNDPFLQEHIRERMQLPDEKAKIMALLRAADFGIEDVNAAEISEEHTLAQIPEELVELYKQGKMQIPPSFISKRTKYDATNRKSGEVSRDFDEWESEGTRKFFALSPLLLQVLEDGNVLFVDEFDARLHPHLTRKIVSLFNSSVTNPQNAQLIFITHDEGLMKASLLRRDQICLVEKDKFGASGITTLVEFKGLRNDASFDKDYMSGRFGAIPFLNSLDLVFHN